MMGKGVPRFERSFLESAAISPSITRQKPEIGLDLDLENGYLDKSGTELKRTKWWYLSRKLLMSGTLMKCSVLDRGGGGEGGEGGNEIWAQRVSRKTEMLHDRPWAALFSCLFSFHYCRALVCWTYSADVQNAANDPMTTTGEGDILTASGNWGTEAPLH